MDKTEVNMDNVKIDEEKESLTDLQVYGVSKTVVTLLGLLKKYTILSQIQKDLSQKTPQAQPVMREFYQFEETKMIMDIRTQFDMVYVYTRDPIIVNNFQMLRDSFEAAITYLTGNMQDVTSILDKNYSEILDEFSDKLKVITDIITKRSIFDNNFKMN